MGLKTYTACQDQPGKLCTRDVACCDSEIFHMNNDFQQWLRAK